MALDIGPMKYEVYDDHLTVMDTRPGGWTKRYFYRDLQAPSANLISKERYSSLIIWDNDKSVIFNADDDHEGFVEFADALDRAWMKRLD